jgi:hypothetical protein
MHVTRPEDLTMTTAGTFVLPMDNTSDVNWVSHPAETERFEEFVIWTCGFTDPIHPPSQEKWEEFQKKVQQLAADFVEYKRTIRNEEYQPRYSMTM